MSERTEFDFDFSEAQENFLADWWSPRKAFYGRRQTGKTTALVFELRRFENVGNFNCVFISPNQNMSKMVQDLYFEYFGEHPTSIFVTYSDLSRRLRGEQVDVAILDEAQEIAFEDIQDGVLIHDPLFIRSSVCESSITSPHYLNDLENSFFDSVYGV